MYQTPLLAILGQGQHNNNKIMEQHLVDAVYDDNLIEVKRLLRLEPAIDVNWHTSYSGNALLIAVSENRVDVLKELLSHPNIDVNAKYQDSSTALIVACSNGHLDCVKLLLKDKRVDVRSVNVLNLPAFDIAVFSRHLEIVKWWLALVSPEDPEDQRRRPDFERRFFTFGATIVDMTEMDSEEMSQLLIAYKQQPVAIHRKLRSELGLSQQVAAEVFAQVIFLCDGLLECDPICITNHVTNQAVRFFSVAKQLPMELQMVLCNLVAGSTATNILTVDSEPAFRSLAHLYL